jgi:hypothetical protein
MAAIVGKLDMAIAAAKVGMSARAFEAYLRMIGEGARSSEVGRLFNLAKQIVSQSAEEPFRPTGEVPLNSELPVWHTKTEAKVRQNVNIVVREKATGQQRIVPYSMYSPTGVTREQAKAAAIAAYSSHNEAYNTEIIGAVHMSAFQYVPTGF